MQFLIISLPKARIKNEHNNVLQVHFLTKVTWVKHELRILFYQEVKITIKHKIMKNKILAVLILFAASVTTFAQKKEINKETSDIIWTGEKIGGSHTGEVDIKTGYIEFRENQIVGGKVVIDMNSITNSDLQKQDLNQKLVNHLKSEDFFAVDEHQTSRFVVTKATKFMNEKASVSGNLTIKGITREITFNMIKNGNNYSSQIKINRSEFDVRYGSKSFFNNLRDKAIKDVFTLDIKLLLKD